MKLTIVLLTVGILNVSAKGYSQNVTFTGKNVHLSTVFSSVKKQTGFVFFYTDLILQSSKPVTIQAIDIPIAQFLSDVFKDQTLVFEISGKNIYVSRRTDAERPSLLLPSSPIRGVVQDSTGAPLAGATVYNRTNKRSTQTNAKGEFNIDGEEGDILQFSFIGYESTTAIITAAGPMIIRLRPSASQLEAVTVSTGYWTTDKRMSVGNIGKVNGEEIRLQPVTSLLQALQGRVAGLAVSARSGVAGTSTTVRVRGDNNLFNNSRMQNNGPLYVIDGLPVDNNDVKTANTILRGGFDPLSTLDPANIENIQVLKDADATAIYGSRGANGVILITTRKAKNNGYTAVSLGVYGGIGKVRRQLQMLDTKEFLAMRHEAFANDGAQVGQFDWDVNGIWDTTRNVNWQKELLGKSAFVNDVQLGVEGGNGLTSFRFTGSYHQENTIYPGDFGFKRYNGSLSVNHTSANKRFSTMMSATYGHTNNKLPTQDDLMRGALTLPPNAPELVNEDGSANWALHNFGTFTRFTLSINPIASLKNRQDQSQGNLLTNARFSYALTGNLKLDLNLGYQSAMSKEAIKFPMVALRPTLVNPSTTASASFGRSANSSWIVEPQIEYQKTIRDHHFTMLAGATFQQQDGENNNAYYGGYVSDELLDSPVGGTLNDQSVTSNQYKYAASYIRLNYEYGQKYILNLSGRRDGSSRFGPSYRYGNFGAVGAGWIFSKESFLSGSNVLSFGKLRGSLGVTGNDAVGDYMFQENYVLTGARYQHGITYFPTGLFNPDFKWANTRKTELGLELGLFRNRLSLELSVYSNRSSDQLVMRRLPETAGFSTVLENWDAVVSNKGIEMLLRSENIKTSNFSWTSMLNVTVPRNKLVKFPGLEGIPIYKDIYIVGKSTNLLSYLVFKQVNPQTGLVESEDFNQDGTYGGDDYRLIHSTDPVIYGGLTNTLRLGYFDFNFHITFSKRKAESFPNLMPGFAKTNMPAYVLKRWRHPGDITRIPKFSQDVGNYYAYFYATGASDYFVDDASFIRLQTVQLSYRIPAKFLQRSRISEFGCYVRGQNLLTLTRFTSIDPETGDGIPPLRYFYAGFQARF